MIPKKIFQTYKVPFDDLSNNAKLLIQEWKDNNPDYEYFYYSDKDIEDFILREYGSEWYSRYLSLPYPVMRADVFRILVIYIYGGFYSDLDMKSINPIDTLNAENTRGLIGVHTSCLLFHPFFGFSSKHPMMKYLVNSLAESIDNNKPEDFNDIGHMVHQRHCFKEMHTRDNFIIRYIMDVTGPLWWSEAILKYLEIEETINLFDLYNGKISKKSSNKILQDNITIYLDQTEDDTIPENAIYKNLFGSANNFYGEGYSSWYGKY